MQAGYCTGQERGQSARGAALITVLMMLMILSALGTAMTTSAQTELMIARNTVSAAQAHAAAESGLNHAVELAAPFAAVRGEWVRHRQRRDDRVVPGTGRPDRHGGDRR